MSYFDSPARERWDRDRFERARRADPISERDYYRFAERDDPDRGRTQVLLDERIDRRGPRSIYEERDRFYEEDRYPAANPRRMDFLDEPLRPETTRQALAPYRNPRPQFIRKQSSLDTFDRRPMARYGDEYRPPTNMPIPLPIRRPPSPDPIRRRPERERERFYEDYEARYHGSEADFTDIRVREEDFGNRGDVSRVRSRSVVRRKRRESSPSAVSSVSSFEEVKHSSIIGRKGRTRMPKRLAAKAAIIQLGLPFEEEEDVIIIHRALEKRHIDEIVEISKKYRSSDSVSYKYEGLVGKDEEVEEEEEEEKEEETDKLEYDGERIHRVTTRPDGTQTVEDIEKFKEKEEVDVKDEEIKEKESIHESRHESGSEHGSDDIIRRTRIITKIIDPPDDHHHHQDLAVVAPRYRDEESIRREIRELKRERRSLRSERESVYESEKDIEYVGRRPRDIVRVERDRKETRIVREKSVPAHPKLIGLAMASLT